MRVFEELRTPLLLCQTGNVNSMRGATPQAAPRECYPAYREPSSMNAAVYKLPNNSLKFR
jgi:hypothetical protein